MIRFKLCVPGQDATQMFLHPPQGITSAGTDVHLPLCHSVNFDPSCPAVVFVFLPYIVIMFSLIRSPWGDPSEFPLSSVH